MGGKKHHPQWWDGGINMGVIFIGYNQEPSNFTQNMYSEKKLLY